MTRWLYLSLSLLIVCMVSPAQAQPATEPIYALAERTVNVRSGPGIDFTRIGQLAEGERVTVTGRSASPMSWLRIDRRGREGWVAEFAVLVEGDASHLAVTTPRAPARVSLPDGLVTAQAFRTVNVRSEPSNQSAVIGRLQNGDAVVVIGRSDDRTGWLWVDLDGLAGWVAYFTVTLNGDAEALPIIDAGTGLEATPMTTVIPGMVTAFAFRTVNVRSGPGMTYAQISQLQNGDVAPVIGRSDEGNNWLLIDFNGLEGWIAYFTVSVTGNPDDLPISTPSANAAND